VRPSSLKKRQRYLSVATELFLEQGYNGTGLDQVIERCGGSKLTIYSYFGDKKGLLKAVVTELTEQVHGLFSFKVVEGETLKSQLMIFAQRYLQFVYLPNTLKLYRLVMSQIKNDPELVDYFLERGASHSKKALQAFLQEQKSLGLLDIDDVFIVCEQLLGALKGNRHIEALFTDNIPNEKEMNHNAEYAVNAFLRSYSNCDN